MTEVKLCPSCREPINYPSGDGCAAMTKHNSEVNYLDVTDIQDQEDGSCIITFDVNKKAAIDMATLGIRFSLYCAAVNTTTEEVLKTMLEKAKQPNE